MRTRKIHKPPAVKAQVKPKKIVADPKVPIPARYRGGDIMTALPKPKKTSKPFTGRRRKVSVESV